MQNWTDTDPCQFGLPKRVRLKQSETNEFALVIERKSRIIMRDGQRILHYAELIRNRNPVAHISLITTAPVCRKTTRLLKEQHITVIRMESEELQARAFG
ncbi:MAG: hypothetical protein ACE5D1_00140 [Fidelibacterota bacterium]